MDQNTFAESVSALCVPRQAGDTKISTASLCFELGQENPCTKEMKEGKFRLTRPQLLELSSSCGESVIAQV